MILREQFTGTIVGMKGGSIVVRLADGTEIICGGALKLHRKGYFYIVPIGQEVKVSRDVATRRKRGRIVEFIER